MTDARQSLGRQGEALAAAELARRGYVIRDRNWRCTHGEVDIVAEHDGWWVFVEVRTRRGASMGTPEASITPVKRTRMIHVAQSYLGEFDLSNVDWRIDVVAVKLGRSGRLERIDVYENAVTG